MKQILFKLTIYIHMFFFSGVHGGNHSLSSSYAAHSSNYSENQHSKACANRTSSPCVFHCQQPHSSKSNPHDPEGSAQSRYAS